MDQGPTTVGSIVGRLKMDRDQWVADVQRTKTDARELGALEPSIQVDADVTAALAKLERVRAAAEAAGVHTTSSVTATSIPASIGPSTGSAAKVDAVAAAERRLAAAVSASESATARAIVAEMKFEDQRDKRKRTAAQAAAAELALAEAIKRSDAAANRATVAEEALAAAQRKAAETALAEAAAKETQTAATVKANEANSTNVSRTGMIAAAVAALVPMLVPLAAFTIGAAGALTMMGISGVVAVMGIKDEMAAGTTVGEEYRTGLQGMKGDLDVLAHTGAVTMLSSFNDAAAELSAGMPMLNRQVGAFTGFLGRSGTNVFAGSMQGARVLEPLMMSIAGWVERLSEGFKSWTNDGGLQTFANYAMNTLPQVETFLSSVSAAIMHILEALAPLGTVGLAVFTGVSDAINGIPVNVLGALTAAVIAGWGAFKLWGLIAPILASVTEAAALASGSITILGASIKIATGPIGWIVAGVGALVAVLAFTSAASKQATTTMQSYTEAVRADTGAIGENVRAQAAKNLQDADAFTIGKNLGISGKTVLDATLDNAAALKEMNTVTTTANALNEKLHKGGVVLGAENQKAAEGALVRAKGLETLNGLIGVQSTAISGQVSDQKVLNDAINGTTGKVDAQAVATAELAKRYGMTTAEYLAAKDSQSKTADQLSITTQAMFIQGDAAGLLKQSLDLLNGKTLSAAGAQNQFDSQLANMSTHMDAAGKTVNRADTELEGMTASAVKNRGELIGLTSAAEANAQAFRDNGGSAEDTRQKLIDMKQAIEDNAVAHGESRDKVHAYLDELFKIPATIPPTKIEVDNAAALAKIAEVKAAAAAMNATISARITAGAPIAAGVGYVRSSADGSTVTGTGTASSDSVPHMLSVGEEVISNKRGQADKYRPLLKAINAGSVPRAMMTSAPQAAPAPASNGGGDVHVSIINKAGAAIGDLIEMHIENAAGRRKVNLATGMQRVAY